MNHYIINKITMEFPKGTSKTRQRNVISDLKERVYCDDSKKSLCYFLAAELQEENITIMDIKLRQID